MLRPTFMLALAAGLGLAVGACGALDTTAFDAERSGTSGTGMAGSGSGGGGGGINTNFNGGGAPMPLNYAELCGGACVPGSDAACSAPGAGGSGGMGMGGAGGSSTTGDGADCKLTYDETNASVGGTCVDAADKVEDMPCLTSTDCGPGLGCDASGLCRRYCCGDVEACPDDTYCAPEPMAAMDAVNASEPPLIPVCIPADECTPLAENDLCDEGLTCTIVRQDGTTACVEPGAGQTGDACPCAKDHFCQVSTSTCIKLCRLGEPDACGPGYICQNSSNNDDVGFCIEI